MEREYGVTIDVKKSSTLSVAGTFNPLVIIKKLNFNHSTIESKDKESKSPEKTKNNSPIKKNNFLNLNYKSINQPNKTPENINQIATKLDQNSNLISNFNYNKNANNSNAFINTESNNLLKSIRTNKSKKEKTEMNNTLKEFNVLKRNNTSVKNLVSPNRNNFNNNNNEKEKQEKGEINSTDVTTVNNKIFEKVENRNNIFTSNRRDREAKITLRAKSGLSEKNEFTTKEKENLNLNNSVHLETISEKGKKKKKKKEREAHNANNNNVAVILPKIINTNVNNNTIYNTNNKEFNISSSKNEEEKNFSNNGKEALRKNYSQSIAQFRKTSESAFAQKRAEANNSANLNFAYMSNNYTNRYTSVMKSYRDKKLHIFDKNKFFYVNNFFILFCLTVLLFFQIIFFCLKNQKINFKNKILFLVCDYARKLFLFSA